MLAQADAERLVTSTAIRAPAFRLVRDGAPLPPAAYAEDLPWQPAAFTATARVDRVAQEFAAGATIVLQALHFSWLPTARYCRRLEQALGLPVQANAYLTPSSAQGFAVHHDVHDVFVLQVAGRKRWRIYTPVLELPLRSQRWSPALGDPGAPVQELVLEPGDTLYVPRGWPHEATTGDGESLHVTVGLHPPTRAEALRAALDATAAADVELRRGAAAGLPAGLLGRLDAELAPERVAARARRRFVLTRRPILEDQLDQVRRLDALHATVPVERRDTVIADLHRTRDGGAVLVFEGKEVRVPAVAHEPLAAMQAASGTFTARALPGALDEAGRLVLVRRLVREGYLRIAG